MVTIGAAVPVAAHAGETPIEITLERMACFGTCPVYVVKISGDGVVSYDGRKYVAVVGAQSAHVERAAVRSLVRDFEAMHFFELQDEYRVVHNPDGSTTQVTDLPTTIVSLRLGDRFKRVLDYLGTPPALRHLEKRIDEIAGTHKWVGPPIPLLH